MNILTIWKRFCCKHYRVLVVSPRTIKFDVRIYYCPKCQHTYAEKPDLQKEFRIIAIDEFADWEKSSKP